MKKEWYKKTDNKILVYKDIELDDNQKYIIESYIRNDYKVDFIDRPKPKEKKPTKYKLDKEINKKLLSLKKADIIKTLENNKADELLKEFNDVITNKKGFAEFKQVKLRKAVFEGKVKL